MIARAWDALVAPSLFRKFALSLVLQMGVVSALFLVAFVVLYRGALLNERTRAAEKLGVLLQVSLENAMLKRDIDGLRDIVDRLGTQDDIAAVMILDPKGEVRFSSRHDRLGRRFDIPAGELCGDCRSLALAAGDGAAFLDTDRGEVLRSVKAVANREPCNVCHGPTADHPVNGILVVDHEAAGLRREAAVSAALLAGSGTIVLAALLFGSAWTIRRTILRPIQGLTGVSRALAGGNLSARVAPTGKDELAELGETLDLMASRLSDSLGRIREREDFLQAILDAVPDGVRVIETDYTVSRANRAYLAQTGLPPGAVIGRPCYETSHRRSEPCISTLVSCPVAELRRHGARMKFTDLHRCGVDQEVHVEVAAAAMTVVQPEGSRTIVVEAIRDLEEMAKISHEQKLSEIGQLATGVAHEIRNPLASIRLGLQAAMRGIEEGDAADAVASLRIIDNEIERCLGITGSLLKLSTPSNGSIELVDLSQLVSEVTSLLRWEAEARSIDMSIACAPGLRFLGSDSEMRMVLTNLVQNAYHAVRAGGRLEIEAFRDGDDVVLAVADDGVGIRPEDFDRIFLPFWSRRADGVSGTGLGLAICRAVVRRAGGTISVASTLGRGSRFTVRIPDADRNDAP